MQAHSPDGAEDLLPGMCSLAQQWLADVPAFRCEDAGGASLDRWFRHPRVQLHLQARPASAGPMRHPKSVLSLS